MNPTVPREKALDLLQKVSLTLMSVLVLITFVAANLQAALWQSSQWLVSTVLPAVVVELTNEERGENNVGPLKRNATLDAAAKLKAEHMAKNQYFAHFAPDGTSPWFWFKQAGYTYAHAGENLAIHFTDSSEVVDAWMNSPTHRENIVNGKYTEIGVGTAKGKFDGYNTVYVVQLFGTPAVAPTPTRVVTPAPATPAPQVAIATPPPAEVTPVPEEESVLAAETPTPTPPAREVEAEEEGVAVAEAAPTSAPTTTVSSTPVAAPIAPPERPIVTEDTLVLESSMIATSSGLAVASVTETLETATAGTLSGLATKPNAVLQITYTILGSVVVLLLVASIALEVRRKHIPQVIYGGGLLIVMLGLWFFHSYITAGAVIM